MQVSERRFPDDLLYDRHHQWLRIEEGELVIGVNDYLNATAGDFLYLHLPAVGQRVEPDEALASVESGKWVGRIYSPVAGVVTGVNDRLPGKPSLLNQDPYGEGWLVRIRPAEEVAPERFLDSRAYAEFLRTELGREGTV